MCTASKYTEGVPAAWQHALLAEIQAEEHRGGGGAQEKGSNTE